MPVHRQEIVARDLDLLEQRILAHERAQRNEGTSTTRLLDPESCDQTLRRLIAIALQIDPRHLLAHNNMAKMFYDQGRLKEAIFHYRKAVESAPDSAVSHNSLGVALLENGERDEAIRQFREALRLKPDLSEAKQNLDQAMKRTSPKKNG